MNKIRFYVLFLIMFFLPVVTPHTFSAEYAGENLIGVNKSSDEVTNFAIEAQALLGGYDVKELSKVTSNTQFAAVGPFRNSKPSASADSIEIYSYIPTMIERSSEYTQVWYKFKTPVAIDKVMSIQKTGKNATSDKILKLAFDKARKLVPDAAEAVDLLGYNFTFAHENMLIGSRWIPSTITLEVRGNREIYVKTPTLVTQKDIPKLGGMSYCKVFSPGDAAKILVDLANGNHDKIPFQESNKASLDLVGGPLYTFSNVYWNGLVGEFMSKKAYLVLDKDYERSGNFRGTCIISPGGFIPAISMRGLAKSIASEGYIVFIVKYPSDLAFWESIDLQESRTIDIGNFIKNDMTDQIYGLLPVVKDFYSNNDKAVIALGHSLGGAALGPAIYGKNNPFDNIILYGVGSFIKYPWQTKPVAHNVAQFFGTNELKTEKTIFNARNVLGINHEADEKGIYHSTHGNRTMQMIERLSHFCIISDMNVGMAAIKDRDGEGPAPSVAVKIFVEHLIDRGLL